MGRKVWVPVVSGSLAPYAAGFGSWLASQAYSRSAVADRLYQFDQLSRWLAREGLARVPQLPSSTLLGVSLPLIRHLL
jgi:hypothetical protein